MSDHTPVLFNAFEDWNEESVVQHISFYSIRTQTADSQVPNITVRNVPVPTVLSHTRCPFRRQYRIFVQKCLHYCGNYRGYRGKNRGNGYYCSGCRWSDVSRVHCSLAVVRSVCVHYAFCCTKHASVGVHQKGKIWNEDSNCQWQKRLGRGCLCAFPRRQWGMHQNDWSIARCSIATARLSCFCIYYMLSYDVGLGRCSFMAYMWSKSDWCCVLTLTLPWPAYGRCCLSLQLRSGLATGVTNRCVGLALMSSLWRAVGRNVYAYQTLLIFPIAWITSESVPKCSSLLFFSFQFFF